MYAIQGSKNQVVTSITLGFNRTADGRQVSSPRLDFEAERLKTITPEQVEQTITAWRRDAIDNRKILEQEGQE